MSLIRYHHTVYRIPAGYFLRVAVTSVAAQADTGARADKRAGPDLQASLLGEHELRRLISLVKSIAEKLEVPASRNPELHELAEDVAPEKVLDALQVSEAHVKRT